MATSTRSTPRMDDPAERLRILAVHGAEVFTSAIYAVGGESPHGPRDDPRPAPNRDPTPNRRRQRPDLDRVDVFEMVEIGDVDPVHAREPVTQAQQRGLIPMVGAIERMQKNGQSVNAQAMMDAAMTKDSRGAVHHAHASQLEAVAAHLRQINFGPAADAVMHLRHGLHARPLEALARMAEYPRIEKRWIDNDFEETRRGFPARALRSTVELVFRDTPSVVRDAVEMHFLGTRKGHGPVLLRPTGCCARSNVVDSIHFEEVRAGLARVGRPVPPDAFLVLLECQSDETVNTTHRIHPFRVRARVNSPHDNSPADYVEMAYIPTRNSMRIYEGETEVPSSTLAGALVNSAYAALVRECLYVLMRALHEATIRPFEVNIGHGHKVKVQCAVGIISGDLPYKVASLGLVQRFSATGDASPVSVYYYSYSKARPPADGVLNQRTEEQDKRYVETLVPCAGYRSGEQTSLGIDSDAYPHTYFQRIPDLLPVDRYRVVCPDLGHDAHGWILRFVKSLYVCADARAGEHLLVLGRAMGLKAIGIDGNLPMADVLRDVFFLTGAVAVKFAHARRKTVDFDVSVDQDLLTVLAAFAKLLVLATDPCASLLASPPREGAKVYDYTISELCSTIVSRLKRINSLKLKRKDLSTWELFSLSKAVELFTYWPLVAARLGPSSNFGAMAGEVAHLTTKFHQRNHGTGRQDEGSALLRSTFNAALARAVDARRDGTKFPAFDASSKADIRLWGGLASDLVRVRDDELERELLRRAAETLGRVFGKHDYQEQAIRDAVGAVLRELGGEHRGVHMWLVSGTLKIELRDKKLDAVVRGEEIRVPRAANGRDMHAIALAPRDGWGSATRLPGFEQCQDPWCLAHSDFEFWASCARTDRPGARSEFAIPIAVVQASDKGAVYVVAAHVVTVPVPGAAPELASSLAESVSATGFFCSLAHDGSGHPRLGLVPLGRVRGARPVARVQNGVAWVVKSSVTAVLSGL